MVNNQLKDQRQERIDWVVKCLKKGKKVPDKDLIMIICVRYGVQQRKASEYIRIARFMIK